MTKAKVVKSFRLSEEVINELEELSHHFKNQFGKEYGTFKTVTPATVIELLVHEKIENLKEENTMNNTVETNVNEGNKEVNYESLSNKVSELSSIIERIERKLDGFIKEGENDNE